MNQIKYNHPTESEIIETINDLGFNKKCDLIFPPAEKHKYGIAHITTGYVDVLSTLKGYCAVMNWCVEEYANPSQVLFYLSIYGVKIE